MEKALEFMETHKTSDDNPTGFYPFEMIKVKRTVEWMSQDLGEQELIQKRKEFYSFFSEHDRRRGTSFLECFPEMTDFWNQCKSLHSQ